MSRRYRNRSRNSISYGKWIRISFFVLISIWLLISIVKKQNPTDVIKATWATVTGNDEVKYMTTSEMMTAIEDKDQTILQLESKLDSLQASFYRIAIVSVDSPTLNLRSKANISSDIIFKIPNGSAVEILYYDAKTLVLRGKSGQWCRIRYADMEGWVWGNFLDIKG